MAAHLLFYLLCLLSVTPSLSEIHDDLVTMLPGWKGPIPTKQYSGYIKVDTSSDKYLHYWFVESANNPASDPVVLWLNGGPGCSSMEGYFNELGPLHFDRTTADNKTIPDLIANPYAWTNIANVVFLEAPAGVGFSYSDNPKEDYSYTDNQTALDNYHFLVNFFSNFSNYKGNDFYITGESYAGIYVPTLVYTIHMMNMKATAENKINLKGFMVGNGCIGNKVGGCGHKTGLKIHVDFYHGHGLFEDSLYDKIIQTCKNFSDFDIPCSDLINEMSKQIGKVNIYDIYTPCFSNLPPGANTISKARNPVKELFMSRQPPGSPQIYYGPDECIDDHIESKYFDNPTVRAALHVKSMDRIGGWRMCTSKIHYHPDTDSLLTIYPTLIKNYRTLIYNGDVDGCVPYNGNEEWTSNLGFTVTEGWRPWLVDDQVAGYVTQYDTNGFKFVTVKGSGHMVPQYRPKQAFAMFDKFINEKPF